MASPLQSATSFTARTAQEHCATLDVNQLAQQGLLTPGRRYLWGWGLPCAACLQIVTRDGCLILTYRTERDSRQPQCIALRRTASNFGYRPLLLCPICGGSSYKLFFLNDCFACRTCHDLKHTRRSNVVNGEHDPVAFWRKGYLLTAPPSEIAPTAPFWVSGVPDHDPEGGGETVCTDNPFFQPSDSDAAPPIIHPARVQDDWKAGRPRRDIIEYPCTCGAGTDTTEHERGCPRGSILRLRARRDVERDAKKKQERTTSPDT